MFARIIAVFCIFFTLLAEAKELKVLMIGNSFSICVGKFLPQVVNSGNKHHLILTSAYIGGCSLQKHYNHLLKAEKDNSFKPYKISVWDSKNNPDKSVSEPGNLNTVLKTQQFDIVTIQQNSANCWNFETFEPFAGELIKYIRKHQKNAEIILHQTWAYRADAPLLKKWGFDQQGMFERIENSYRKLAEKYGLRMIPAGKAMQIFRAETPDKYQPIDLKAEYKEPALPDYSKDPVGISLWQTTKAKGRHLHHDFSHLNDPGKYFQALVWYAFLFDESAADIKFIPKKMAAPVAILMQKSADQAVKSYRRGNCKSYSKDGKDGIAKSCKG